MSNGAAVLTFASAMLHELDENEHKRHWSHYSPTWLLNRLNQEVAELERAVERGQSVERVLSEAADVANFAMMVADRVAEMAEELAEEAQDRESPSLTTATPKEL